MTSELQNPVSSGVEALIQKLKDEGVAAGQDKAVQIIVEAQQRADWIVQEAEREAQNLLTRAREETELIKRAGQDEIKLALRDALMSLRAQLSHLFGNALRAGIGNELAKDDFLRQLIIELAGQVRKEAGLDGHPELAIQVGLGETESGRQRVDMLNSLTRAISSDLLRTGVRIDVGDNPGSGLIIQLNNDDLMIDFTDETVAALLLERLRPCFRDLLDGTGQ